MMPQALPWARELIAKAEGYTVPAYGSAEWEALPDAHPAKVAACVLAAETQRTWWDPAEHARRLRLELDETARIAAEEADLDATWTPVLTLAERELYAAGRPSFAELAERRGEPEKAASARLRAQQWREVA
ncbi:hypothetical protein [Geodermatophilus sp. SYSU D00684]